MSERIIFTDIDGVILPVGSLGDVEIRDVIERPADHLNLLLSRVSRPALQHLRTLAEETGARFVLISSWRRAFPAEFTKAFLIRLGLFGLFHADWKAPMKFSSTKGHDIGEWFGDHRRVQQRDCLVVDDEDLGLPDRYGFEELIQIKPISNVGFSRDDLARALKCMRIYESNPHAQEDA